MTWTLEETNRSVQNLYMLITISRGCEFLFLSLRVLRRDYDCIISPSSIYLLKIFILFLFICMCMCLCMDMCTGVQGPNEASNGYQIPWN